LLEVLSVYRPQTFPHYVLSMRYLVVLNISNGNITSLPASMVVLSRLMAFYASNNKISKVPPVVGGFLDTLKIVDLASNELTEIPVAIFGETSPIRVILSGNRITHIPQDFCTNLVLESKLDSLIL